MGLFIRSVSIKIRRKWGRGGRETAPRPFTLRNRTVWPAFRAVHNRKFRVFRSPPLERERDLFAAMTVWQGVIRSHVLGRSPVQPPPRLFAPHIQLVSITLCWKSFLHGFPAKVMCSSYRITFSVCVCAPFIAIFLCFRASFLTFSTMVCLYTLRMSKLHFLLLFSPTIITLITSPVNWQI